MKKVNISKLKENKFKKILNDYYTFYKENLRRRHLVIYVLLLIVFFVVLNMLISGIDTNNISGQLENASMTHGSESPFITIFKEAIPFAFLIIIAGITPFVYLPLLGFILPYNFASDIATIFATTSYTGNLILMSIGSIISIFGVSIAIAMGMYYCKVSTKRFRYSQSKSYGMSDIKRNFYTASNKNEKLEEFNKKELEKAEKMEKFNVKIPFMNLLISFLISALIMIIGTFISVI